MDDTHAASSGSSRDETEEESIEELVDEIAATNPDPITRRESLEQELMEEGRSSEGAAVATTEKADDRNR
jgi:hypothetical protein